MDRTGTHSANLAGPSSQSCPIRALSRRSTKSRGSGGMNSGRARRIRHLTIRNFTQTDENPKIQDHRHSMGWAYRREIICRHLRETRRSRAPSVVPDMSSRRTSAIRSNPLTSSAAAITIRVQNEANFLRRISIHVIIEVLHKCVRVSK